LSTTKGADDGKKNESKEKAKKNQEEQKIKQGAGAEKSAPDSI
jgi:hypothetical protein